jgi:hypothetical protein
MYFRSQFRGLIRKACAPSITCLVLQLTLSQFINYLPTEHKAVTCPLCITEARVSLCLGHHPVRSASQCPPELVVLLCHKVRVTVLIRLWDTTFSFLAGFLFILTDVSDGDRLCDLVVRVPGYTTEMYCASCEVRTGFIYVM